MRETLLEQTEVFVGGEGGYHTYRIPAVVGAPGGAVLAFCEGRKAGAADMGDIDVVLRRSFDQGRTWEPPQLIWDDGANTCGNPCPVVDRATVTIWLLLTHNLGADREDAIINGTSQSTRTVWVTKSTDEGATWSKPVEITADAKRPDWTWYATGPGAGIQMWNGRLVVPCDHVEAASKEGYSHVIYSDDHGRSWRLGGSAGPKTNECQVVELASGALLLNMRNYRSDDTRRATATSDDGGLSWSAVSHDPALIEPICQASIRRYSASAESPIFFSNPASRRREKMTIRLSSDQGHTWPVARTLESGPAAYSDLVVLPDGTIGCLYERGAKNPYEKITFARFSLEWLLAGKEPG